MQLHRPRPLRRAAATLVALLGVALVAAACGDESSTGGPTTTSATTTILTTSTVTTPGGAVVPAELVGAWSLQQVAGPSGLVAADPAAPATLTVQPDGAFSGNTGCNVLNGRLVPGAGGALGVETGPMTMRACTSPTAEAQQAALVAGLPTVRSVRVEDGTMTMLDAGGQPVAVWAAELRDLMGTVWTVTGVNNGRGAVVGSADTERLTVELGPEGRLNAFGGCNQFDGTWSADGDRLTVSDLTGTEIGCDAAVLELEQQFATALTGTRTIEVNGDVVTLRDDAGAAQLTLRRS